MDIFTEVVHSGKFNDYFGAITCPIYQSSTYVEEEPGHHKGYQYSRLKNPTRDAYEDALACLEKTRYALSFSSGVAAEQAIIQLLEPKREVLVCENLYGGTKRLFNKLFSKYEINFIYLDMADLGLLEELALSKKPSMVWLESPSNPLLKIFDIKAISEISKKVGAIFVVDNTFASPIFQNPVLLGADISLHSSSKYIGGHSDVIGGAIMLENEDLFKKLKFIQFAAGSIPSPFECFLLLRSIKTLAIRMSQHEKNARAIAQYLLEHPKVEMVFYPGLPSHPNFELAKKQMRGFSGVVSFLYKGSNKEIFSFFKKLRLFKLAESLGGVESMIGYPYEMSHKSVEEKEKIKLGILPNLVRLSIGIEALEDLICDLDEAL